MTASVQQQFVTALGSEQPVACLRAVVQTLVAQGADRAAVEDELEAFRDWLRSHGRDDDEDIVLDVMDFLTGWSSPHMKV